MAFETKKSKRKPYEPEHYEIVRRVSYLTEELSLYQEKKNASSRRRRRRRACFRIEPSGRNQHSPFLTTSATLTSFFSTGISEKTNNNVITEEGIISPATWQQNIGTWWQPAGQVGPLFAYRCRFHGTNGQKLASSTQ